MEEGRRRFGGVASLDAESTWRRYRKDGCDLAKVGNAEANQTTPGARSSSAGPNVRNCRCAAGLRHRFPGMEGMTMRAEELVQAWLNELCGPDDWGTARDMAKASGVILLAPCDLASALVTGAVDKEDGDWKRSLGSV